MQFYMCVCVSVRDVGVYLGDVIDTCLHFLLTAMPRDLILYFTFTLLLFFYFISYPFPSHLAFLTLDERAF